MRESKSPIIKIWVVLLVTLVVLGGISFFSYTSYQRFDGALEEIAAAPENATLTEKIFSRLSALETSSRAYALTLADEDYGEYFLKAQNAQMYIDSLVLKSGNKPYRRQVDTLRILFQEKLNSFDDLINYKLVQSNRQEAQAMEVINRSQEFVKKDTVLIPVREKEQVLVEDTLNRPNFLQRLFGAKPKEKLQTTTVLRYDTAYQESVDTLLESVKQAIADAEKRREYQDERLTDRELALVNKDQIIVNKLQRLMANIRNMEKREAMDQKEATAEEAKSSFRRVVLLASIGGVLTLVLVFLVARDFSEAKRLQDQLASAKQRAEELGKAKEDFLASMSHEIRTPLNAVIGFTEQLGKEQLKSSQREKLGFIKRSSNHLLMLVNDILDFSKIEAGKLSLEKIGFKPYDIALECLESIRPLADQKRITLEVKFDAALEEVLVLGDPLRLKQVLLNLLSNAVKFTERGTVLLEVKARLEEGRHRLTFKVQDTGRGISPEKLKSIFEGFSQEDNSITRKYGGTGLGLSISQRLLALHNAQLEVDSTLGKGSTFSFEVSYSEAQENGYEWVFSQETLEEDQLKGKKLLLVDDDEMNHLLLEPYFKRMQLDYAMVHDGESAVELALDEYFDFILVDLQMPGISGYEVIEQLRLPESASHKSFVVLCTANALVKQDGHPTFKQVDALLLKPFKEAELHKLLGGVFQMTPEEETDPDLYPAFDLGNFKAFASGDADMVRHFVDSFIQNARKGIGELWAFHKAGEYGALAETAHRLKNTYTQLQVQSGVNLLLQMESLRKQLPAAPHETTAEWIERFEALSEKLFVGLRNAVA
jgi:signal transduction histidine kinase/HPt (histidine-containing phosphotransfer) domain-containing protein